MTAPPTTIAASAPPATDRRRWLILAVLCASVFIIVLDGTIVNVALPTLASASSARRPASCSGSSTRTCSCSPAC